MQAFGLFSPQTPGQGEEMKLLVKTFFINRRRS